jgi:ectoine hydroxylase-related dioxygenase (phytanoyl-CoA dioxygenase family)
MRVKHLPVPTHDVDEAKRDMDTYGYALMADALTSERIEVMKARLFDQVRGEARASGHKADVDSDDAQGAIGSILNKGRIWQDLVDPSHPVYKVVEHSFTPSFDAVLAPLQGLEQKFIVSSLGVGFKHLEQPYPPAFHTDQGFAPGQFDFPMILQCFFLLSDFNPGNGSTWITPGSHRRPRPEWGNFTDEGAWASEAPAGTCIIFEGRTWHAAGVNSSGEIRTLATVTCVAPYIRQRELLSMNIRDDVIAQLSDAQLKLLGFDTMYQGPSGAFVGFNLIEPTLGRTNVSHKLPTYGELHG